jgi:tetratricopeptide (TPR) repeat protein
VSREDWYRNEDWNPEIESAFRSKLSRSRSSRPQHLRIQANYLAKRFPHVALQLIEEYFATGDKFDVPNAHCARADAFVSIGKIDEALAAYRDALDWEKPHPHHISVARIEFPKLVAECGRKELYGVALGILTERFQAHDHKFHDVRYIWNGANALIAHDLGHRAEAREFAERALRAAVETRPPFRSHPTVGLVGQTDDDFGQRIKRIARPSRLQSLFRLISRDVMKS